MKRKVGGAVSQKITGANTKLTFTSSNKKVARVDKNGKIRFVGVGRAVITIRAAENKNYQAVSKKCTVTVVPKTIGIQGLTSPPRRDRSSSSWATRQKPTQDTRSSTG